MPRSDQPGNARLVHRHDLTSTLAIFRFELEGGVPPFKAGQFILLGKRLSPRKYLWRAYSIATPPEVRDYIDLYVRWVQVPGKGRFTSELWRMEPGDPVLWKPPRGRFTIAEQFPDGSLDSRRLLFIAGGTGLAPFLSCVPHLRHQGTSRRIVLCHGARYAAELGQRELFEGFERESRAEEGRSWHFRYLATISRPDREADTTWRGHTGRVETLLMRPEGADRSPLEQVMGEPLDPAGTCIYVCGFEGTVRSVLELAEPRGFRTAKNPRPDGSYDLRFESYG